MMKTHAVCLFMLLFAISARAQKYHDERSNRGVEWFKSEQSADGSFTAKVLTSSPAYNCQMILLYEYLGLRDAKLPLIKKLVPGILKYQNADGGISSFPGGPHDQSVSLTCYMALRVAGQSEEKLRVMKTIIEKEGGVKTTGFTGLPFMMSFGFDHRVNCLPKWNFADYLADQGKRLPWVRVVMIPLTFIFQNRLIHTIPEAYAPKLEKRKACKVDGPKDELKGEDDFIQWAQAHLGPNMTLFDYTPTTIPTLMALSKTKFDRTLILKSVKSLEDFYYDDLDGDLMASPGEASVSETGIVARSFLDLGMAPDSSLLQKSLSFILSTQNKDNGSFGFSKSNLYFPDPNDTATSLQFLHTMQEKQNSREFAPSIKKGLAWILTRQNKDGGFGAWDKNSELNHWFNLLYRTLKKNGIVVGESIGDDTGRIILALHEMREYDPAKIDKSVDRAVKWLRKEQEKNGSFFWPLVY